MDMSVSTASHRIGLYRVPYFAPHEYISFQWVSDSTNDLKNGGTVVFKSTVLPKDEDFYQFQYLWIDNGSEAAIGASVPFQLRSPKTEELCTMEDEEEFMVVRSNTSLITEQMSGQLGSLSSTNESLKDKLKEGEKKYSELLGFSEVLNADLGKKSEAYLKLEEQNLILLDEKNKWEQLKTDLACVIQDKLVLEERLHRHQKALQTIQMDRDLMAGERDQANREISLLKEERTQIIANSEQVKNMLNAVSKSNAELAVFKSSNQEQQKLITNLAKKLETLEANNALKYTEIDELKQKLLLKEREFEILSQEMVNRSKTKFNEIDVLKKQLSDAERNLCKYVEAKESSSMTHEDFPTMSDEPIKSVRETQSEMREFMAKSSGTSSRMTSETASMSSMATTDSRRLLEDRVIQSHLGLNEPEQSDNEANEAAEDFEDESLSTPIRKLNDMMLGFKEIEDSPRAQAYAGARPKVASYEAVSVSTSPMGPPCAAATPTNSEAVSASTSPMALTKSPKSPLER
jgi:predicted transcriptional regulator